MPGTNKSYFSRPRLLTDRRSINTEASTHWVFLTFHKVLLRLQSADMAPFSPQARVGVSDSYITDKEAKALRGRDLSKASQLVRKEANQVANLQPQEHLLASELRKTNQITRNQLIHFAPEFFNS